MCGIFAYKGTKIPEHKLVEAASKLTHRGPDITTYQRFGDVFLGFHRLSIMDLTYRGNQPFVDYAYDSFLVCNGEIYNEAHLRKMYPGYDYRSTSDCEVLLPLIQNVGIVAAAQALDAEFALVYFNGQNKELQAARDPIGIRPLFYGVNTDGEFALASEAKALTELFETVIPFPPGHVLVEGRLVEFRSMTRQNTVHRPIEQVRDGIATKLTSAIQKRLHSDAPIGFLLSGGLDSSLVCAIAAKLLKSPIKTFSVGSELDAIDNPWAEKVAKYIGADHTTVTFSQQEVMKCLDELIYQLETWDVTTIRASIGMYLVCRWIRENTNIKVLMTGEVSDELFGYKYTDFAPTPAAFQEEAQKRIRELYLYDVLRADRCISSHALEARVPFGDLEFVDFVMSIDPQVKMNTTGIGKYLLRSSFQEFKLLPEDVLFRDKAAFSDAVGHSVADGIKAYAEIQISDSEFEMWSKEYKHAPPLSKEGLFYRQIFDKHYPGRDKFIPALWLPNQEWENCKVTDPSARVLPNYGKSGQ